MTRGSILAQKVNLVLENQIESLGLLLFSFDTNATLDKVISECEKFEFVEFAEPNYLVQFEGFAGKDPKFPEQWYLEGGYGINWKAAMEIWTPRQTVPVGVIDSGVNWKHPDLEKQIHENLTEKSGFPGKDDDGNDKFDDIRGWDFIENDNNPEDYTGHGTFIASLIAAAHDDKGMVGVCRTAKIIPVRAGRSTGSLFHTMMASNYAVDRGARILNWSFSSSGAESYIEAVEKFNNKGVLLIAAASNKGQDNDGNFPRYPASLSNENILSVASIDKDGSLSSFSNWGKRSVDLAAPGSKILSAEVETETIQEYTFEGSMDGWRHIGPQTESANRSNYKWTCVKSPEYGWGLSDGSWSSSQDFFGNPHWSDLNYKRNTFTYAISPQFDGKIYKGFRLSFYNKEIDVSDRGDEFGALYKYDDSEWQQFSYQEVTKRGLDFSRIEDRPFKVALSLESNSDNYVGKGVFIGRMALQHVPEPLSTEHLFKESQGTSYAAPLVAGVAAMIWSHAPELSWQQVKQAILDGAKSNERLKNKVLTGGQLDALKSLQLADKMRQELIAPPEQPPDDNGWRESDWFGRYNEIHSPWVYHEDHGYLYVYLEKSLRSSSFWFYDLKYGWMHASKSSYPFLYRGNTNSWMFYTKGTRTPRHFWDSRFGDWTNDAGYYVNASAKPSEAGRATGGGFYFTNSRVRPEAFANEGWQFDRWSGDSLSSSKKLDLLITRDFSLVARFEKKKFSLIVSASPVKGGSVTGDGTYEHGESRTISATPNLDYVFLRWDGSGSFDPLEPSTTVGMSADRSLIAIFEKDVPEGFEEEPNDSSNTANSLTPGDDRFARIQTHDDEDWYSFQVGSNRKIEAFFEVNASSDSFLSTVPSWDLAIMDDNGSYLANAGLSGAGSVTANTKASGQHYLKVSRAFFLNRARYGLSVKLDSVEEAKELEPNNDKTSAQAIGFNQPIQGVVHGTEDKDSFVIEAPSSGLLIVNLIDLEGNLTSSSLPVLKVLSDDNQTLLTLSGDSVLGENNVALRQAGKVYAQLSNDLVYDNFSYDLSLSFDRDVRGLEFEPNDLRESAQALTLPAIVRGSYGSGRDIDWFLLSPVEAGRIDLSYRWTGNNKTIAEPVSLTVHTEAKTIFTRSFAATDEQRFSFAFASAGKYWVKLEGTPQTEGMSYQLETTYGETIGDLEVEPNDLPENAALLTLPIRKIGSLGEKSDKDVYRFAVVKPSLAEIRLESSARIFDGNSSETVKETWSIIVHNANGDIMDSFLTGGGSHTLALPTAGQHLIEIGKGIRWKGGDYELNVSLADLTGSWETEPNDERANASFVTLDGNPTQGNLSSTFDEDWYAFDLNARTVLSCSVFTLTEGDALAGDSNQVWSLAVYSGNDANPVRSETVRSADPVNLALDKGRHFLRIKPVANRINQDDYYVKVATLAPSSQANDDSEPNDAYSQANPIRIDLPLQGNLQAGDTEDWYRFQFETSGVFRFTPYLLQTAGGEVRYELLNASGSKVQSGVVSIGNRIEIPIGIGGTYSLGILGNSAQYGFDFDFSLGNQLAETESNDVLTDANLMPLETPVAATLEDGLDVDWFKFPVSKAGVVRFYLEFDEVDSEEWFYLSTYVLDDAGRRQDLGETWVRGSEELSILVSSAKNVYATISSVAEFKLKSSDYVLTATFEVGLSRVESEPNDYYSNADALELGESIFGQLGNSSAADWYKVSIGGAGTLTLDLSLRGNTFGKWKVHVYRDGMVWYGGAVWSDSGKYQMALGESGSYGLKVYSSSSTHSDAVYSLTPSFELGLSGVETEPNNDHQNADQMNFGEEIEGELGYSSDKDWYKISVPGAGMLTIKGILSGKEDESEWRIHLYRAGEYSSSSPDWMMGHRWWENRTNTFALGEAGSYYVKVSAYPDKHTNTTYKLTLSFELGSDGVETEPNGDHQNADAMNFAQEIEGKLSFLSDEDWYKISVLDAGLLSIKGIASGEKDKREWYFTVYRSGKYSSSNPERIGGFRCWGNYTRSFALGEAGTYYLKVYAEAETHANSTYKLTPSFELGLSGVETEPNDDHQNADPMNFGEEIEGELDDSGDKDWYKISVPGAGMLTIKGILSGKEDESEWRIHLYQAGEYSSSSPDWMMGHRWWENRTNTFALGEAGTYYVKVSAYSDKHTNSTYKLTPSFDLGLDGVETEPNGDHQNADAMNFAQEIEGELSFLSDEDWYKISVLGAGMLTIKGIGTGKEDESEWRITVYREGEYSSSSPEWVGGNRWWGDHSRSYALGEAGTYYVKVHAETTSYTNSTYKLTPSFESGLPGVETEPNDDHQNADPMNFGEGIEGKLGYSGDKDWYKISVPGAGMLTIKGILSGKEDESEWRIVVYRAGEYSSSNPEWVLGHRWWANRSKSYALGEAGTYYVKVYAETSTYTDSTYKLTPSFGLGLSGVETEPNDDHRNADAMNFGEEIKGELSFLSDEDWYKISVLDAGLLSIKGIVSGEKDKQEWHFTVYRSGQYSSSNPERIGGFRCWGNYTRSFALGEAGTYYVKVYAEAETHANSTYELTPSFELGLSGVETEPNGDHQNADPMNFGEEIEGELDDSGDKDWYKISVPGAGMLTIKGILSGVEDESEWSIHLYRAGEYSSSSPDWMMGHRWWGNSTKAFALGEAGTYYVKIHTTTSTHTNSTYKLMPSFELGLSGLETEPNDDHQNADAMNFGEEIEGQLTFSSDKDWFKVNVSGAGMLTIKGEFSGKKDESEWTIAVYQAGKSSSSSPVWLKGHHWWGDYSMSYELFEGGTYYIKVHAEAETHTDSAYKLTPSFD